MTDLRYNISFYYQMNILPNFELGLLLLPILFERSCQNFKISFEIHTMKHIDKSIGITC